MDNRKQQTDLENMLNEISRNHPNKSPQVFQSLNQYLSNILDHPNEMSYKIIDKSNKDIQNTLLKLPEILDVLKLIGFSQNPNINKNLLIYENQPIENLNHYISILNKFTSQSQISQSRGTNSYSRYDTQKSRQGNNQTNHDISRHENQQIRYQEPQIRNEKTSNVYGNSQSRHDNYQSRHDNYQSRYNNPQSKHDNPQSKHDNPQSRHDNYQSRHNNPQSRHDNYQGIYDNNQIRYENPSNTHENSQNRHDNYYQSQRPQLREEKQKINFNNNQNTNNNNNYPYNNKPNINNYKVVYFVYDLTKGMAKKLSSEYLGNAIEGIYHTSVYVYDREYYYSGGINKSYPRKTKFGTPMEEIKVGYTNKTKSEFEDYLKSINDRFTSDNYNIISHNCNHFSNTALQYLTGKHIPRTILKQHEEILKTALKEQIKPYLEQIGIGGGGGGEDNKNNPLELIPLLFGNVINKFLSKKNNQNENNNSNQNDNNSNQK